MMDSASPIAPVTAPPPAATVDAPARKADDGPSFAERLDEQSEAQRPKTGRKAGKTAGKAEDAAAAAPPEAAAVAIPQAPVMPPAADPKGDNPGEHMADSADNLATDKAATDAAADPGAIIAEMLQMLTAPAKAPPATKTGPAAPAPPDDAKAIAAAKPDPRAVLEGAAGKDATTSAKKPADEAAAPPVASADGSPAPLPAPPPSVDSGSQAALAGTGAGTATPAAPHATPEAAPRAAPVPLTPSAIGLTIAKHAAAGEKVFEISLSPDDLGRVDVRLEFAADGRLTAHVYADRPETLQALERDRGELARSLAGQGLNADGGTLNFSLRDGRGNGDSNNGESGGRRGGRGRPGAAAALAGTAPAHPRSQARDRAIDIEV